MEIFRKMWQDESGLILSAEAVSVGTLGVLGAVTGLSMASTAVDEEMKEFAQAIRSLDQSYGYAGHQGCRAWSAGSYYRQRDVNESLHDLCINGATDVQAIQDHVDAQRKAGRREQVVPQCTDERSETVPVRPNQIPAQQPQDSKPTTEPQKTEEHK
ncbi:MAG: hypothetical protein FJ267_01480 [Planctomycetes bacterium]|nr:hypothetical protein [Planctomycetota bacterium]